jgi:hypothetical protein
MDRQARKLAVHREEGSEVGSELGSNTDSDSDEKVTSFVTNFGIKSFIYFNIVSLILRICQASSQVLVLHVFLKINSTETKNLLIYCDSLMNEYVTTHF